MAKKATNRTPQVGRAGGRTQKAAPAPGTVASVDIPADSTGARARARADDLATSPAEREAKAAQRAAQPRADQAFDPREAKAGTNADVGKAYREFPVAKEAQEALSKFAEKVEEIARINRKDHDLIAIRDLRDSLDGVRRRLEQFVAAP